MTDHSDHHDDHASHADHEHHGGVGIYIGVFVGLCLLTTLSFLTYFDFWREHVPVHISRIFMMAVSCTKAMLVIMFFMHLKWEANWKWVLTVPASVMSALLILALVPDIGLRMRYANFERLLFAAEKPPLAAAEKTPAEDHGEHADSSEAAH